MVNTVRGPVPVDQLGKTLMHEHFYFGYPGFGGNTVHTKSREELIDLGVEVANRAKAQGVQTIVDATPSDCGRDPELLKEVSERTGIHIICSTGYYYEGEGAPAYFKFKMSLGTAEQELYDIFMGEITDGIGDTGIKPGVFKLASGKDIISDYEQLFFKVAAKAQKETGIPIITHTQEGTMGPDQARLLISEGVNPKKILIGHMDGNTDINYHIETLEQGVYSGFDRVGIQQFVGMPLDSDRIDVLVELINRGFEDQLALSHDTVNIWLGGPTDFPDELNTLLKDWEIDHIFKNIVPALLERGIKQETIDNILINNPRNIFSD